MKLPVDQVEPMIRALRKLDDTLYENHITVKMEEGTSQWMKGKVANLTA